MNFFKEIPISVVMIIGVVLTSCNSAFPCSAFLFAQDNRHVVGKNYDWAIENGRILINKRGKSKIAFGVKNPVSWRSTYGSLTFNQYGQEFPIGGINETGLVIEALWLNETVYPPGLESIPQIDNMQWIQYQLDISSNVEDVISNDKNIQIHPISPTAVHYFIADKTGKSLIIEAVDGAVHRYLPDSLNPPLLTNDPYDKSIRLLRKCSVFGGDLEVPRGDGSISRFIRTAVQIQRTNVAVDSDPVEHSFRVLNDVRILLLTKWSIVYDLDNMTVHFRTASKRKIKSVDLNRMDFNCDNPVSFVTVSTHAKGDISDKFKVFTTRENYLLIKESIEKTDFLKTAAKQLVPLISAYKETIQCVPR